MNNRNVERLISKHQEKERADQRKKGKRQERYTRRFRSFEELAKRNREIVKQAERIVGLSIALPGDQASGFRSPWIVLNSGSDQAENYALGHVLRDRTPPGLKSYEFLVYAAGEQNAAEAKRDPLRILLEGSYSKISEVTYQIAEGGKLEEDEIMQRASSLSSGRAFTPVNSLKRFWEYNGVIGVRLESLQQTIDLFQDAAANPDLNPRLAELAQLRQSA